MIIHKEWMSNNDLFGTDFTKNYELKLAKDSFDIRRYHSNEGYNIPIDNFAETVNEQVVINNHNNPMNSSLTSKNIFFGLDTKAHLGSYTVYENENYIVNTIPKSNKAYKSAEIELCDDTLKCVLPNGKLISYPCAISEASRNSLKVEIDKLTMMQNMEFFVLVQNNDDTAQIPPSYRFIFGKKAYIILDINDLTMPGIIKLKMKNDLLREGLDNINNNGLANQNLPTQPIQTNNLSINGLASVKLSATSSYSVLNNTTPNTFTWSLVDAFTGLPTTYASIVSSDSSTCVIKAGIVAGKQIKLTATCNEDNSIVLKRIITIFADF